MSLTVLQACTPSAPPAAVPSWLSWLLSLLPRHSPPGAYAVRWNKAEELQKTHGLTLADIFPSINCQSHRFRHFGSTAGRVVRRIRTRTVSSALFRASLPLLVIIRTRSGDFRHSLRHRLKSKLTTQAGWNLLCDLELQPIRTVQFAGGRHLASKWLAGVRYNNRVVGLEMQNADDGGSV